MRLKKLTRLPANAAAAQQYFDEFRVLHVPAKRHTEFAVLKVRQLTRIFNVSSH